MLAYLFDHYGDLASVFGLMVALIGFRLTLRDVRKAERAAEEARKTAGEAVARLKRQAVALEIGNVIQSLKEVADYCRIKKWPDAIKQCDGLVAQVAKLSDLRRLLREDRDFLQMAVLSISDFQAYLSTSSERRPEESLPSKRLAMVSQLIATFSQIQGRIESEMTEL